MADTWRVQGPSGTYVEMTDDGVRADDASQQLLDKMSGRPVRSTFPALYTPQSDTDPVWWYLAALSAVPAPRTITGTAPTIAAQEEDGSVVY